MNIIEKTYQWSSSLSTRKSTKRIILHHAESSKCTPDDIHRWHLARGWAGIGYHFFVRKDGSIYRGRPEDKLGAHASNNNSDSIGICFEGSYMKETMPQVQINAGKELVTYLKNKYGITKVQRHQDVCSTNCPGTKFPFNEIAGASVNTSQVKSSSISSLKYDEWVLRLQKELNNQFHVGLVLDGIQGPKTLAGCPTLSRQSKGEITRLLQERLHNLGYQLGDIDGINGLKTQSAIMQFQRDHGLVVDGIVGKKTWQKLLMP